MKVTETEIRFKTDFQQPKTGLPKKPVLTSLLHLSPPSFCGSLKSSGSIQAAFLKYHIPLVCLATFDEALYRRPSGSPRRLRPPPHPSSSASVHSSSVSSRFVRHDLFLVNPCWFADKRLFVPRCFNILFLISDSIILHGTDVNDTASVFIPFLNIEITFAHFQSSGNTPSWSDLLNSIANGTPNTLANSFRALG